MIDVLIIGGGSAGLASALSAVENGAKVAVLGKTYPTRSQTSMAQGGINAALGNVGEDSIEAHIKDTLKSAHSLGDEVMIRRLCEKAPSAIFWLDSLGTPFSRLQDGKVAQRKLGGTSGKRACYAQDFTGLKILHTLYDAGLKADITFLNEYFLLNFIVEDGRAVGITAIEMKSGEIKAIKAKSIIIATGGYAGLYRGFTTNSTSVTGDGIASAIRAGCELSDMEFIQFHPTALKKSSILIGESARGEGGYLVNGRGERFVDELKPRDVVAKAIWEQIENGEEVFLDIRHLGEAFIEENLPQERKLAKLYEGIDPVTELIPIKPVAHYTMGGIDVNHQHQTKVEGLFAVGECANSYVHGANRLGGNSLLETIVFGREAGENAAKFAKQHGEADISSSNQLEKDRNYISSILQQTNQINFYDRWSHLGEDFYKNSGILRNEMGLNELLNTIQQIKKELPLMGVSDKSKEYNTNLFEFIEFNNMVELSEVVVLSAIRRKESRGAHQREDFPNEDNDKFKGMHSIFWKEQEKLCNEWRTKQ